MGAALPQNANSHLSKPTRKRLPHLAQTTQRRHSSQNDILGPRNLKKAKPDYEERWHQ
jgi:hypothetical protein